MNLLRLHFFNDDKKIILTPKNILKEDTLKLVEFIQLLISSQKKRNYNKRYSR